MACTLKRRKSPRDEWEKGLRRGGSGTRVKTPCARICGVIVEGMRTGVVTNKKGEKPKEIAGLRYGSRAPLMLDRDNSPPHKQRED